MGLMNEYREFKAKKKAEKTLSLLLESPEYKELLAKIAFLEQKIQVMEAEIEHSKKLASAKNITTPLSDDEKKIAAMLDGKTTPEDFVKLFADEGEEFYPNGRRN